MSQTLTTLTIGLSLFALSLMPAYADGVDEMFTADGSFIDELEIIGDVIMPSGEMLVAFEMREQHLKIYIHPDAAYVTIDPNNPILVQQTPFHGVWVSTQSPDVGDWPICNWSMFDEFGEPHAVHGTVIWTNTGIGANGYSLAFHIDLGTCDSRVSPWIYSRAAMENTPVAGGAAWRYSGSRWDLRG